MTQAPSPLRSSESSAPAEGKRPKIPLNVRLSPLSLGGLDRMGAEDLLLFIQEEERPLQGAAGLVDWRLCGALTRMLKGEQFSGSKGELLLTVAEGRLPAQRIFLVGSGQSVRPALADAFTVVTRAGGSEIALCPPGWDDADAASLQAQEALLAAREAGLAGLRLLAANQKLGAQAIERACAGLEWASFDRPALKPTGS